MIFCGSRDAHESGRTPSSGPEPVKIIESRLTSSIAAPTAPRCVNSWSFRLVRESSKNFPHRSQRERPTPRERSVGFRYNVRRQNVPKNRLVSTIFSDILQSFFPNYYKCELAILKHDLSKKKNRLFRLGDTVRYMTRFPTLITPLSFWDGN